MHRSTSATEGSPWASARTISQIGRVEATRSREATRFHRNAGLRNPASRSAAKSAGSSDRRCCRAARSSEALRDLAHALEDGRGHARASSRRFRRIVAAACASRQWRVPHAPEVLQLHAVRRQTLRTSGGTAGQRARVAPRSRQPSPRRKLKRSTTTVPACRSGQVASAQSTRRCVAASNARDCGTGRRPPHAVGARERRLQGAPVLCARSASRRARGRRALRSLRHRRRPSRTRVPVPMSACRERAEGDRGDRRECRHGEHEPHVSDTSAVRREYLFRAEIASQC